MRFAPKLKYERRIVKKHTTKNPLLKGGFFIGASVTGRVTVGN